MALAIDRKELAEIVNRDPDSFSEEPSNTDYMRFEYWLETTYGAEIRSAYLQGRLKGI